MDADQLFQLWLSLVTLVLASLGVVLWYFARKVIDMPSTYATKQEVKDADDNWKTEVRLMREERRQDSLSTQAKLDRVYDAVTGIHRRIDDVLLQRGGGD